MSIPPDLSGKATHQNRGRSFTSPPPDWLPASKPGARSITPSVPEWLKAAPPGAAPAPSGLPDWLAKVAEAVITPGAAAPAPPPMPPSRAVEPEEDMGLDALRPSAAPEMLTPAAEIESQPAPEPESEPSDFFAALRAETPQPPAVEEPPDWMSKPSEPEPESGDLFAALRAETPQPPAAEELPDWMSRPSEPEPLPSTPLDAPDWLSASAGPESALPPETEKPAEMSALPDWLSGAELETPPTLEAPPTGPEKSEAKAEAATGLTDWLADMGGPSTPEPVQAMESAAPDWLSETPPPPPAAAGADAPDWLKEAAAPEAEVKPSAPPEPAPEPAKPDALSAEAPDWLSALAEPTLETPASATPTAPAESPDWLSALAEPAPMPPAEPKPEAPAPSPIPAEAPDWLNALAGETPPPAPAEAPDWLNALAGETPAPAAPSPTPSPAPAEAPDWLNALAGETPPPEPAAPPPTPAEAPDWLNALAGETPPPAPAVPATPAPSPAPAEAPDWLNALAGETPPPEPAAPPTPAPAPMAAEQSATPGEDLLDWMSGEGLDDLGLPAVAAPAADQSEDLLGLTGDLAMPAAGQTPAEGIEAAAVSELPEWLRGLKPAEAQSSEEMAAQASGLSPDMLSEIGDLRFEKIIGQAVKGEASAPEKVGALKDVAGAIRPELIFDAQTLKGAKIVSESILTKEQERRILLLEALLAKQKEDTVIYGKRRGALPLVRWLIALLLMVAIVAPIVLGISILSASPAPSGGVNDARQVMDGLPPNARVLVAFEYEPDTSAEMETLAGALLGQLASHADMSVVAVSTKTFGAGMADRVFRQTQPASAQWINLGYLPGGSVGISSWVVGSAQGSPFGSDFVGHPTGLDQPNLKGLAPNLIIVLASSGEDVRAWVEQAGRPTQIKMLAAISASAAPMAAPYRQSGQLAALMSGVNDAVAYRSLTGQKADPPLTAIWNAQALGGLAAALIIVAGSVIYGVIALREQQEQNA